MTELEEVNKKLDAISSTLNSGYFIPRKQYARLWRDYDKLQERLKELLVIDEDDRYKTIISGGEVLELGPQKRDNNDFLPF